MSSSEDHCVGCGDSVQPGQRSILAKNKSVLSTWRSIFQEKLDDLQLKIHEECLTKAFICRKCKRGFESYNSAKIKLLENASNALQYLNTTAADSGRKRTREDDHSHADTPAAKRHTSEQGHSPSVHVS